METKNKFKLVLGVALVVGGLGGLIGLNNKNKDKEKEIEPDQALVSTKSDAEKRKDDTKPLTETTELAISEEEVEVKSTEEATTEAPKNESKPVADSKKDEESKKDNTSSTEKPKQQTTTPSTEKPKQEQKPSTTAKPTSTEKPKSEATTEVPKSEPTTQAPASSGSSERYIWVKPTTHQEWVVDKKAWTETVPKYGMVEHQACNICNKVYYSVADADAHESTTGHGGYHSTFHEEQVGTETVTHPEEGHYEEVSDNNGYWIKESEIDPRMDRGALDYTKTR